MAVSLRSSSCVRPGTDLTRTVVHVTTNARLDEFAVKSDSVYLQNRGTGRYLFRDNHERWFILQASAKKSVDAFVRWVYLPDNKPAEIARTAMRQRTVIGYRYVQWSEAPEPASTTVTAMFVSEPWPDDTYECGSCGAEFESPRAHALHCWESHPWIPTPKQVRLHRSNTE